MSSIVNKVKDALHSDKDKKHDETHATGTHGTHGTTGTHTTTGTHGAHSTTGNTLGGDHTAISTGVPHATPGSGGVGTEALGSYAPGPAPNTAGSHKSDALNKADPRIDSDLDGSRNLGATSAHQTMGGNNAGLQSGTGVHTGTGYSGVGGVGTTGAATHGIGQSGVTGYDDPQGIHGPHSSRVANTVDPRDDSDRDHRAAPGTHGVGTHTGGTHGVVGHSGPGPAPNTAGPHKSDMLNKADPRVDSNLDGSKTVGGNKTYQ